MADQEQLITLTAGIVAAHVSNNSVAVAPDYATARRGMAVQIGLGRKMEEPTTAPAKRGRKPRAAPEGS